MKRKAYLFLVLILIMTAMCGMSYGATLTEPDVNTTCIFFVNHQTLKETSEDCIVLINKDSNGKKHYGIIDVGTADDSKCVDFLKGLKQEDPNFTKLDFLAITHLHVDHNGNIKNVLNYIKSAGITINKIYMKENDPAYVKKSVTYPPYRTLLAYAVENGIPVVGVSYASMYCNYNDTFFPYKQYWNVCKKNATVSETNAWINGGKDWNGKSLMEIIEANPNNITKSKFQSFGLKNNTTFSFGSATIDIFNWEIYASSEHGLENGKIKAVAEKKGYVYWNNENKPAERETIVNDNYNSLVFRVTQGNKKALLTGDFGESNDKIRLIDSGDNSIGEIDIYKAGHHGHPGGSIVEIDGVDEFAYLKALLRPSNSTGKKYAVITSHSGFGSDKLLKWFDDNNVDYLFETQDTIAVSAVLDGDDDKAYITYKNDNYANVEGKWSHVSNRSTDFKTAAKEVKGIKYTDANTRTASSWAEFKNIINEISGEKCSYKDGYVNGYLIKITDIIYVEETIKIPKNLAVKIVNGKTSGYNATIIRKKGFVDGPIFYVEGYLSIGDESTSVMTGTLKLSRKQCSNKIPICIC